MVGDRGSVTQVRIRQLKALPGAGWITALRAPQVAALARDDGPLQMSLFDDQNFAEITDASYPGERLICCRNPALAAQRAAKRESLLQATEKELEKIAAQAAAGRLKGADKIGVKVGKVINKRKSASTSSPTSQTAAFPGGGTRTKSPTRRNWTGSTSSALPPRKKNSAPPRPSKPTKTSGTSNAISGR